MPAPRHTQPSPRIIIYNSIDILSVMQNEELRLARTIIETTGTHLFLTGKAGTG